MAPRESDNVADGPNVADWLGAGADVFAAVGTVGAFAFALYLFLREQERGRGARVSEVYAFWRRTDDVVPHEQIEQRLLAIYRQDGCIRTDKPVPPLRVAPHHDAERPGEHRWYRYELWIRNATQLPVNTVEVWIRMHDHLDRDPGQWQGNTCPIAVNASAAPALHPGPPPRYGFTLRRALEAGEDLLLAHAAYPSRIEFPTAAHISFLDSNGQQWSRDAAGLRFARFGSSRKPGRFRRRGSSPGLYYWNKTLGERSADR
jgi:hypothetical protein